ncbi:MAG: metallophosphoesterase, partial [Methylotenera sp.]|nr:metallophosphoesterase [Oligoflexia bacterium]
DFMEGSPYYLADRGRESFRVMNGMGFDAVAIGNHDWMMGTEELNRIVAEVPPQFAFLGANFLTHSTRQALREHLKPYHVFDKAGSRIAVLGLTTNEWIYQSPADRIAGPINTANRLMKEMQSRSDFVIALTHLGVAKDRRLVERTRGVDLVVGGHSHTVLSEPVIAQDRRGRMVGIVQTGAHGENVGELLVDVVPGQPLVIKSYELHAVNAQAPRDPQMQSLVQHARRALDAEYGASWLSEVVGFSEVNASYSSHSDNPWNQFVTDSFRESTGADAVLHVTSFTYPYNTQGSVTREGLFSFFPRLESLDERKGWSLWTARIPGLLLKELKKLGEKAGLFVSIHLSGGGPIHDTREYTIAFPEGIALRSKEIPGITPLILRKMRNSNVPIWESLEAHFRQIGVLRPGGTSASQPLQDILH